MKSRFSRRDWREVSERNSRTEAMLRVSDSQFQKLRSLGIPTPAWAGRTHFAIKHLEKAVRKRYALAVNKALNSHNVADKDLRAKIHKLGSKLAIVEINFLNEDINKAQRERQSRQILGSMKSLLQNKGPSFESKLLNILTVLAKSEHFGKGNPENN